MLHLKIIYIILFAISLCASAVPRCDAPNSECMLKMANKALHTMMAGDPMMGVESSDPLYLDYIYGDLAGLKYNFSSVTVNGFSKCYVEKIKTNMNNLNILADVICQWDMTGHYVTSGRLIILPINGDGDFSIHTKKILLTMNIDLKMYKDDAGKSHFGIKQYTFDVEPLEPVVFYLGNLFNGNKELGDQVLKFANENYKVLSKEVGGPAYKANIKKVVKNINKYLKNVDANELMNG